MSRRLLYTRPISIVWDGAVRAVVPASVSRFSRACLGPAGADKLVPVCDDPFALVCMFGPGTLRSPVVSESSAVLHLKTALG